MYTNIIPLSSFLFLSLTIILKSVLSHLRVAHNNAYLNYVSFDYAIIFNVSGWVMNEHSCIFSSE